MIQVQIKKEKTSMFDPLGNHHSVLNALSLSYDNTSWFEEFIFGNVFQH